MGLEALTEHYIKNKAPIGEELQKFITAYRYSQGTIIGHIAEVTLSPAEGKENIVVSFALSPSIQNPSNRERYTISRLPTIPEHELMIGDKIAVGVSYDYESEPLKAYDMANFTTGKVYWCPD